MMLCLTVADLLSRLALVACDCDSEIDPQGKLWKISYDQAYQENTVENSHKEDKPEEHPKIVNMAYK